ncbi:MAG: pyridoxine 5'-phosphate synthase, partial [Alphaproteobacteria bacterium]|nr:pyridoxine 5'-phosphate synthase [Alphaproteobacteria bacterium]
GHQHLAPYVSALNDAGIRVSLFIEPERTQLEAAVSLGAPVVELHTGAYCDSTGAEQERQFQRIADAAVAAGELGLECHAGHGLTFDTVGPVAALANVRELNIGHFLIGEAIFSGLDSSIKRMRSLMDKARAERSA